MCAQYMYVWTTKTTFKKKTEFNINNYHGIEVLNPYSISLSRWTYCTWPKMHTRCKKRDHYLQNSKLTPRLSPALRVHVTKLGGNWLNNARTLSAQNQTPRIVFSHVQHTSRDMAPFCKCKHYVWKLGTILLSGPVQNVIASIRPFYCKDSMYQFLSRTYNRDWHVTNTCSR